MTSTEAGASLSSDLRISVIRLTRRLRSARGDHGLTLGQLSMLATLDRHGPMTPSELAAHEGIRPPSVTRTLASLEDLGMVTRAESAHDRRSTLVTLTPAALTLLTDDRRRRDALLADLLDGLTADERETLARAVPLLDRLAGA